MDVQTLDNITIWADDDFLVTVEDEPHTDGAFHEYALRSRAEPLRVIGRLKLQKGGAKDVGLNGWRHGAMLGILQHRYDHYVAKFDDATNAVTRGFIAAALASDDTRNRLRRAAGTKGYEGK